MYYNGSYLLLVGSDVSTPLSGESRRRVPKEQQSPCLVQTDARPAVDAVDVNVGVPCTVYREPCGCGLNRVCWFVTSQIWECCAASALRFALLCIARLRGGTCSALGDRRHPEHSLPLSTVHPYL